MTSRLHFELDPSIRAPGLFDVDVKGGSLRVGRWDGPEGSPVVLAAHGITANLMSFAPLAAQLADDATLVAPDLRGRGQSRDLPGPFSMAAHADDLAAVLDHLGVDRCVLVGHSMGAFVSIVAAHRHPDRFSSLVLVDGGMPFDLGPLAELPVSQLIAAIIGPAAERLRMTFPSRDAYRDHHRDHPAIGEAWSPWVEAYLDYDLFGEEPSLRPSCTIEAMEGDSESQLTSSDIPDALASFSHDAVLIRAPRGIMNGDPLYSDEAAQRWESELTSLTVVDADDVNHYTIGISDHGAAQIAEVVRRKLA